MSPRTMSSSPTRALLQMLGMLLPMLLCPTVTATKPDGYVAAPRPIDPHPPKYEYGYAVASPSTLYANNSTTSTATTTATTATTLTVGSVNDGGGGQGHREIRDGDKTQGNYYVNFADGQAQQSVQYVADDWGYHPVVRYSSHDDHSHVSSHFALGDSAVERLRSEDPSQSSQSSQPPHVKPSAQQLPTPYHQPDQLQIVGIIPREFPPVLPSYGQQPSTRVYPLAEALISQPYVQPQANNVDANVDTSSQKHSHATVSADLLNRTQSLINGYDVIDINHSVETVAQNSLFQVASDEEHLYNAASDGQRQVASQQSKEDGSNGDDFHTPIFVDERRGAVAYVTTETPEVSIKPGRFRFAPPASVEKVPKQINLQIFDDNNNGQYLKETTHDHTNSNEIRIPEAPPAAYHQQQQYVSSTSPSTLDYAEGPTIEPATPTAPIELQQYNADNELHSHQFSEAPAFGTRYHSHEPPQPSSPLPYVAEPLTYVTSERSIEHSLADTSAATPKVEIEKQVLLPFAVENYVEKQFGGDSNARTLEGIVNKHIENTALHSEKTVDVHSNAVDSVVKASPEVQIIERIVEKPVPYPYPVEVKHFVDRPYPAERIVEKEIPVSYAVEKVADQSAEKPILLPTPNYVEAPVPVTAAKPVDRPVPLEVNLPMVAVPYALHVPIHIPFAVEIPYQQFQPQPQPSHQSHPQQYYQQHSIVQQYIPPFQALPPSHPYAHQPYQHHPNSGPPTYLNKYPDHHKPLKPMYLSHLHILPSHLQHYKNDNHFYKSPTPSQSLPSPLTTQLHPIRPQAPYSIHPRPVYGLPNPQLNHPQTQTQPTYAGKYAYTRVLPVAAASSASAGHIIYRDEYNGPPPPLPRSAAHPTPAQHYDTASSSIQHQYLQQQPQKQSHAPQYHWTPSNAPSASKQQRHTSIVQPIHYSHQQSHPQHQPPSTQSQPQPQHSGELETSASIQHLHYRSPNSLPDSPDGPEPKQKPLTVNVEQQPHQERRSLNFGRSMRWENGFRPPMVPSVQTDEHGIPLDMATV